MSDNQTGDWRQEEALKRFQMIAELLADGLDKAKKTKLRKQIAFDHDLSERTIRRYEKAYEKEGFFGLMPKEKKGGMSSKLPEDYDDLVEEASILKKEVTTRSVEQIIFILENEGKAKPGVLKRSTLQRHLADKGLSKKELAKFNEDLKSDTAKRFCKPHRMMLVQADIKYGTGIVYCKDGKNKTAYLSSLIDDHSRYVLSSFWYESQDEYAVNDVFHKAILMYGHFDKVYTDNGSVYISHQLKLSCAKLGIKLVRAKPRSGKSKGKVEKFHQIVDDFIAEVKLEKCEDLGEINRLWQIFLNEYYHTKAHEGIREYYESLGRDVPKEGISPKEEFERDSRSLQFYDVSTVSQAFLYHEQRNVDKGGCISFKGFKYEVGASYIGSKVEVGYDPTDLNKVLITYKDTKPFYVNKLVIPEYCGKDTAIPESLSKQEAKNSRFLDVLRKKHEVSKEKMTDAISYGNYKKEENSDV